MYNAAVVCLLFTLSIMYLVFPSFTFSPIASAELFITIKQRFPAFCHLHTPSQPISINCTLHIGRNFVINIVAVISNSYAVTVNK